MKKSLLIGIAGGSASGKTSVAKKVCDYFKVNNSVYILKQDDYYKDQSHLSMDQRIKTNYDHPMAFDTELMVDQITDLVNGKTISKPTYDYTIHTRSEVVEEIVPAEVIIIEGLFALENAAIRDMCDLKIFVDTDSDIRLIRRMMRDINERGRSLESIVTQYQESVRDMHIQFVEPTKRFADIIIPEGGNNEVAIDLIITKISSILD
ncbi:MAG: uridine kinase [Erysipelotrichales bacterium]